MTNRTPYEVWTGRKPVLKHIKVWGSPAEARPYRPDERKLDSRTVSCYFVGYPERSRGYKFYNPTTRTFFETGNARFFEDVEFEGEDRRTDVVLMRIQLHLRDRMSLLFMFQFLFLSKQETTSVILVQDQVIRLYLKTIRIRTHRIYPWIIRKSYRNLCQIKLINLMWLRTMQICLSGGPLE